MSENPNGKTMTYSISQLKELETKQALTKVYNALMEKGYNPINQIVGYIMSGDPTYITSHKSARSLIMKVERDEILEELVRLNRRIAPDIVFAPSLHDVHQDHHTIAEEAIRAFKRTSILGYEEPWNNLTFNNQVYVTLEERHVNAKIAAVERYISQRGRVYASGEYIRSLAVSHGVQIGRQYAEVFETDRWIL